MLEECGLIQGHDYRVHPVDIGAGEQFQPDFLALSPNNKIPAIRDSDGPNHHSIALFESGAILLYLAEKFGKLIPTEPQARYTTLQWLMFQMGGVGPMLGQAHHFRLYAPEKLPYAINRYTNEAKRLYQVIEKRLTTQPWLAGEHYTIADIATFPWLRSWQNQGVTLSDYPHLQSWFNTIEARPAVQRGVQILASARKPLTDDRARDMLFGHSQYANR